jgi:hypothetical protein
MDLPELGLQNREQIRLFIREPTLRDFLTTTQNRLMQRGRTESLSEVFKESNSSLNLQRCPDSVLLSENEPG